MPCSLRFEGPLVLFRFSGAVTAAEIADAVNTVAAHPCFDEQRYHIADCRDARMPALDDALLLAMAPVIGATLTNRALTTILVPDSEGTRAFAQHCRPMFRHLRLHFAPDLETAMEWMQEQTVTAFPRIT